MFWNRSTTTILQQWQMEIDHSLETGQTPLLQLGESLDVADALPALAALQEVVARRVLVNAPLVLIGGRGAAWLLALWQRRSPTDLARGSGLRVVYGGADAVTHVASATITVAAEADRLHHWREVRPLGLAVQIEPSSQPATPPRLDVMPLVVADGEWSAAENGLQDWVAWLAVALILIVIALIIVRN